MISIIIVSLLILWSIMGLVKFMLKFDDGELPKGIKRTFYFHLICGPISWIIGIGRIMWFSMDIIYEKIK